MLFSILKHIRERGVATADERESKNEDERFHSYIINKNSGVTSVLRLWYRRFLPCPCPCLCPVLLDSSTRRLKIAVNSWICTFYNNNIVGVACTRTVRYGTGTGTVPTMPADESTERTYCTGTYRYVHTIIRVQLRSVLTYVWIIIARDSGKRRLAGPLIRYIEFVK